MADAGSKTEAEKLAAARKKVAELKKKQQKKATTKTITKKKEAIEAEPSSSTDKQTSEQAEGAQSEIEPIKAEEDVRDQAIEDVKEASPTVEDEAPLPSPGHSRAPSLSIQSRMRSASFRRTSLAGGPLSPGGLQSSDIPMSPDGDAVTEIYRKQALRIEELEKENKRLDKESKEASSRLVKAEEELEDIREASGDVAAFKQKAQRADGQMAEIDKLRNEITSLQRQNALLQAQSSKSSRHASSPIQAHSSSPPSDLAEALQSKSATIEFMEIEISNLRAKLNTQQSSSHSHSDQVLALEAALLKSQKAAESAQSELTALKKNLERASERSVREASQRTSAETKIKSLETELAGSTTQIAELTSKTAALEMKITTLTSLHKDSNNLSASKSKERDRFEREAADLRARLAALDNENLRLRDESERRRKREAEGVDDAGLDELEDEERSKLEIRIRELESENFDLRRGVWRNRREEMARSEGKNDGGEKGRMEESFDDVDLSTAATTRRTSAATGPKASGFVDVLSGGISALTGGGGGGAHPGGFLDDEDDDEAFDEDAFRKAQEDAMKARMERVREIKRGLKQWEGWRLDLVETRRAGGGGFGEIFSI